MASCMVCVVGLLSELVGLVLLSVCVGQGIPGEVSSCLVGRNLVGLGLTRGRLVEKHVCCTNPTQRRAYKAAPHQNLHENAKSHEVVNFLSSIASSHLRP